MFDKQNTENNIQLLCAMRHFYDVAKRIKGFIFFISVLLPLTYMAYRFMTNIMKIELGYDKLMISVGLVWMIIMYFLERFAEGYIAKGTKVQEKFDTNIFDLPVNEVLVLEDVSEEDIYDGASAYKGNKDTLMDWYGSSTSSAPHYLKVLIAQRMNIIWGNELKKKYQLLVQIILILIAICGLFIAIYLNMNFIESVLFLLLPLMPLFYLGLKTLHSLTKQIGQNKSIDKKILSDCSQFEKVGIENIKVRCRLYQNYIFTENRLRTVMIPSWFYWLYRNNTNNKLVETNNRLLEQYSDS